MNSRREAREIAIQTLYAIFLDFESDDEEPKNPSDLIIEKLKQIISFNKNKLDKSQLKFINFLLNTTLNHLEDIDKLIKQFSRNWDFHRIAAIDKSILRMAIMEIEYSDTPNRVVINEAIELAKDFCGVKSSRFVNGILDAILHRVSTKTPRH